MEKVFSRYLNVFQVQGNPNVNNYIFWSFLNVFNIFYNLYKFYSWAELWLYIHELYSLAFLVIFRCIEEDC